MLEILNNISKHSDDTTTTDDVSSWFLQDIYKKYPKVFLQVAAEKGLHIINKMSSVDAAAMWINSNVSFNQAHIILRHLHCAFGHRVQVPFDQLRMLGKISLEPNVSEFTYKKEGESEDKVGEQIQYWNFNAIELLELDFVRLIEAVYSTSDPTFEYDNDCFETGKGVIVSVGADHGAGKSRYMLRVNYLPSSARRTVNKVDHGTRTLQIAEVKCKRDVLEVQKRLAPVINQTKREMESTMLVGVRYNGNEILCKFIPKEAKNLRTMIEEDKETLTLSFYLNDKEHFLDLKQKAKSIESTWVIVPQFKLLISGDLCFYATSTGCDGRSHCCCTYCDSVPSSWNEDLSSDISKYKILTKDCLHKYAAMYERSQETKSTNH